jgi:DNA-binding FrmR family transcriptional regulator
MNSVDKASEQVEEARERLAVAIGQWTKPDDLVSPLRCAKAIDSLITAVREEVREAHLEIVADEIAHAVKMRGNNGPQRHHRDQPIKNWDWYHARKDILERVEHRICSLKGKL